MVCGLPRRTLLGSRSTLPKVPEGGKGSGVWAGVDNAWKQEKPEATRSEMLDAKRGDESHLPIIDSLNSCPSKMKRITPFWKWLKVQDIALTIA
jgi:hypothetical protein